MLWCSWVNLPPKAVCGMLSRPALSFTSFPPLSPSHARRSLGSAIVPLLRWPAELQVSRPLFLTLVLVRLCACVLLHAGVGGVYLSLASWNCMRHKNLVFDQKREKKGGHPDIQFGQLGVAQKHDDHCRLYFLDHHPFNLYLGNGTKTFSWWPRRFQSIDFF